MPRQAKPSGKLTLPRLLRLERSGKGYRDPVSGSRYTASQVKATKAAHGITAHVTQALRAKGFGTTLAEQYATAKKFRAVQDTKGRRKVKGRDRDIQKTLTVAIQARDSLADVLASYQGQRRQAGRPVTRTQALRSRALWDAMRDLNRGARTVTRAGAERRVGKDSKVARALVKLGLRPAWATWRVGDSPAPGVVAKFLERTDGAPPPWSALTKAERARVNEATQDGGPLAPGNLKAFRAEQRAAETAALAVVGRRAAGDPRALPGEGRTRKMDGVR